MLITFILPVFLFTNLWEQEKAGPATEEVPDWSGGLSDWLHDVLLVAWLDFQD